MTKTILVRQTGVEMYSNCFRLIPTKRCRTPAELIAKIRAIA